MFEPLCTWGMFQEDDKSVGMKDENGAPQFMRMVVKSLVGSTLIFYFPYSIIRAAILKIGFLTALQFRNNIYKGDIDFVVEKTKALYSKCPSLKNFFLGLFPLSFTSRFSYGTPFIFRSTQLSCWVILVSRLILVLRHMIFYLCACPSSLLLDLRSKLREAPLVGSNPSVNTSDNLSSWASIARSSCIQSLFLHWDDICASFSWIMGFWKGKKPTTVEDLTLERALAFGCGNWCTAALECCAHKQMTLRTYVGFLEEWNVVVSGTLLASNWNWGILPKKQCPGMGPISPEYASIDIYKLTRKHFSLQLTMASTMVIDLKIDNVIFANGFEDFIDGTSICPEKDLSPGVIIQLLLLGGDKIEQSSIGSTRFSHQVSWHRSWP
ncbi:Auxin transport protein BIG [Vitis vinifera]|uniref:Auxin transport protein BIG n=1 Tax=Vitis vinifera TaxID=29760 RepID=A0A438EDT7_VITVI|nr:Auxin transport protein BIG [Vitis vinifera]